MFPRLRPPQQRGPEGHPPFVQPPTIRPDDTPVPELVNASVRVEAAGGFGSGVVIWCDGTDALALSNWHVVKDALGGKGNVAIRFPDGTRYSCQIVDASQRVDLSLLSFQPGKMVPFVAIAEANAAAAKDTQVYQIGYPQAQGPCFRRGKVHGYLKGFADRDQADNMVLLFNPKIIPGDSGSGVFDQKTKKLCALIWGSQWGNDGPYAFAVTLADIRTYMARVCLPFWQRRRPPPAPPAQPQQPRPPPLPQPGPEPGPLTPPAPEPKQPLPQPSVPQPPSDLNDTLKELNRRLQGLGDSIEGLKKQQEQSQPSVPVPPKWQPVEPPADPGPEEKTPEPPPPPEKKTEPKQEQPPEQKQPAAPIVVPDQATPPLVPPANSHPIMDALIGALPWVLGAAGVGTGVTVPLTLAWGAWRVIRWWRTPAVQKKPEQPEPNQAQAIAQAVAEAVARAQAQPTPYAAPAPPAVQQPPQIFTHHQPVPVPVAGDLVEAYEWALKKMMTDYPGKTVHVQMIESLVKQYLSGKGLKNA